MRMWAVASLVLLAFQQPAAALDDIYFDPKDNTLYLEGEIKLGDAVRVRDTILGLIRNRAVINTVTMYSPGGSTNDATDIGRQIRTLKLATVAPVRLPTVQGAVSCRRGNGRQHWTVGAPWGDTNLTRNNSRCLCASACFLVWAGGVARAGDWIGLHRPFFRGSDYGTLSPAQAEAQYNRMVSAVTAYLREVGIPDRIVEKMMAASSQQIFYLTSEEARYLRDAPYLTELVISRCGDIETWNLKAAEALRRRDMATWQQYNTLINNAGGCREGIMRQLFQENVSAYLDRYGH